MSSDSWGTPLPLFRMLDYHFGPVDLDACAADWSALVTRYCTAQRSVLKRTPKASCVYENFPYSDPKTFTEHARAMVLKGTWGRCILLGPHNTAEGWWGPLVRPEGKPLRAEWRYDVLPRPLRNWTRYTSERLIVDVLPVEGRLTHRVPPDWEGAKETARFSSAVVVLSPPNRPDVRMLRRP